MPTKKRGSPEGAARRRRIAAGIVQGKSLAAIARAEGVSRQTIWKQAATAEVHQIVVAAVNHELERIGQMFGQALKAIEEAFRARMVRAGKDGQPIDLGPDHYARLTAVDRFIKLLTAGRPVPKAVEVKRGDGTMTLAELEVLVGENPAGSHFLSMSKAPGTPTM